MELDHINQIAPTHEFSGCTDVDRNNAGHQGCKRCTLLELGALQDLRARVAALHSELMHLAHPEPTVSGALATRAAFKAGHKDGHRAARHAAAELVAAIDI